MRIGTERRASGTILRKRWRQSRWKSVLGSTSPLWRSFSSCWVNWTGEVEALRMAAATAAAEGTVRRRASSEWEVGLGLMVWRKHEGVCVSVRGRLSEFEKNRWWDLVLNGQKVRVELAAQTSICLSYTKLTTAQISQFLSFYHSSTGYPSLKQFIST